MAEPAGDSSASSAESGAPQDAEAALAKEVEEDARRARRVVAKETGEVKVATVEGEAVFQDPIVEGNVRLAIGKEEGPILIEEVSGMDKFSVALDLYVSNLSGIEHMTSLTDLDITQNTTSDLSPIAGLTTLTRLNLTQNDISDLTPIAGLTNLTYLHIQDNVVSDLSPLAGLTELTELNLQKNEISDISALAALTKLEEVNLTSNQISDVTALASLPNLKLALLSKNQITDISPLLEAGFGEGTTLRLWGEKLDENSVNNVIPALREAGVTVQY